MDETRVTELKVCCLVVNADKILLIKEWSDGKKNYFWNVIKGTFEGGIDKDLVSCAQREIAEEAKLSASPIGFLGVVNKNGFSTRVYFGFLCEPSSNTDINKNLSEKEIVGEDIKEVRWFDLSEVRRLKENQFVNDMGYYFVQRWLSGKVYPTEVLKEIDLNSISAS
jgi:ADP-ribose pyrophosphatase YjhB (NUDIX family)